MSSTYGIKPCDKTKQNIMGPNTHKLMGIGPSTQEWHQKHRNRETNGNVARELGMAPHESRKKHMKWDPTHENRTKPGYEIKHMEKRPEKCEWDQTYCNETEHNGM